jgi:flagellar basal body-associated protein FliL
MEGGVGIILLLLIVVAIGFIVAMYVTGGALLSGSRKREKPPREKADPVERSDVYAQHDELR